MEREFIKVEMTIEKVFDGSTMEYEIVSQFPEKLSEKFKKVLREDWEIDVDTHTAIFADEILDVELAEERIYFED